MLKIYGYTLLAFLAATQLTACDITEEQKAKTAILRLGECQAVETLSYTHATLRASIDEPLMRDAVHWQHQLVMGRYPTASRLQLHAARDIALLEIEQTDLPGKKVNRILAWYNGAYCQSMMKSYQDEKYGPLVATAESKATDNIVNYRTAMHLLSSAKGEDEKLNSCPDYKRVVDGIGRNPALTSYRPQLLKAVAPTLHHAANNLPAFKRAFIEQLLQGEPSPALMELILEVSRDCNTTVSESLPQLGVIRSMQSARTKGLQEQRLALQKERACGEWEDYFCMYEIRMREMEKLVEQSEMCDNTGNQDHCSSLDGSAQEVWERRSRKIDADAIYYVVKRLAPAANKPESVSSGVYNAIAREVNACRIEGEKATQMTKADADEYEALFCTPKVRWNQGQSSREELNRLIERWHTLVSPGQNPPRAYGFTAEFAKAAPWQFYWACSSTLVKERFDDVPNKRLDSYRKAGELCRRELENFAARSVL